MNGELIWKLQQAAASTFEQLGFLFADEELSETQAGLPVEAMARVRFEGPKVGVLEVQLAGGLLEVLANNMLGVEESPERGVVLDAFGEVANVICGNVLPLVAGPQAVFDLHAPEVWWGGGTTVSSPGEGAVRLSMGLETGRADLAFTINDRVAGQGIP